MPFFESESDRDPKVELRQVGPNAFQLLKGFRYREPGVDEPTYTVAAHDLFRGPERGNATDLASVPPYLWWFVASHGRHTRPAIMHDQLIYGDDRTEADRLFRVSLDEVGVSFLRRWLMWAAVSLATMWEQSKPRLIGFVTHLIAFFGGLAWAWFGGFSWSMVAAIGLGGLLWGLRIWPLSVVGVLVVGPATVLVWITIAVVWLVDALAFACGKALDTNPAPPTPLPTRGQGEY